MRERDAPELGRGDRVAHVAVEVDDDGAGDLAVKVVDDALGEAVAAEEGGVDREAPVGVVVAVALLAAVARLAAAAEAREIRERSALRDGVAQVVAVH